MQSDDLEALQRQDVAEREPARPALARAADVQAVRLELLDQRLHPRALDPQDRRRHLERAEELAGVQELAARGAAERDDDAADVLGVLEHLDDVGQRRPRQLGDEAGQDEGDRARGLLVVELLLEDADVDGSQAVQRGDRAVLVEVGQCGLQVGIVLRTRRRTPRGGGRGPGAGG